MSAREPASDSEPAPPLAALIWRVTKVLLVASLVPLLPFIIIGELPGDRWLPGRDQGALPFGVAGAVVLALDILIPIPSSIVAALIGARLGLGWGFLSAWLGLSAGHVIGYGIGVLVPARARDELPALSFFPLVLLTRPVPVLAEAVAISAGALRVPFARFAPPMLLGNALYAGVMAANGALLLPDSLVGPGLIAPLIVPVIGWFAFRIFRGKSRANSA